MGKRKEVNTDTGEEDRGGGKAINIDYSVLLGYMRKSICVPNYILTIFM